MIDYVTLLLVNMAAGLAVLAFFLWWGIERKDRRDWAPALGISGLVATVAGLALTVWRSIAFFPDVLRLPIVPFANAGCGWIKAPALARSRRDGASGRAPATAAGPDGTAVRSRPRAAAAPHAQDLGRRAASWNVASCDGRALPSAAGPCGR